MRRALVVIDGEESTTDLLAEAGDCVQGTGADIVLVTMMTEKSLDRDVETLEQIGKVENKSYGTDAPLKGAERATTELARDVLPDEVEYTTVSRLIEDGDEAETILEIADEHECDHIFLTGRKRSPTGKALFGDRAQTVLLNADGYVTVAMQ